MSEQGSENYDSTVDTLTHIRRVGEYLAYAQLELTRRSAGHDHSKLCEPEKSGFDTHTPRLKQLEYGSEDYERSLRQLQETLAHHYLNNSHHPEHYPNGFEGMDLFDLIEMCADWQAAAERVAGTNEVNLDYNAQRFGIDGQLYQILANTLERWPRS